MSIFFPHDNDARHDPRILSIERLYSNGYALFFKTVEYMDQNDGELEVNRFLYSNLKDQIKAKDEDEVRQFIEECLSEDIGLFYTAEKSGRKFLRSHRLDRTIKERLAKSNQASEAARLRWERQGNKLDPKKKESKTPAVFPPGSAEVRLARLFYDLVVKASGAAEPDFQRWAEAFEKMIRLDKRAPEYIEETIRAVAAHVGSGDFRWGKVVMSPEKLRLRIREGKINPDLNKKGASRSVKGASSPADYDQVQERRRS
jgi:hypothetical protein